VVGKKAKDGKVELWKRHTRERIDLAVEDALPYVKELIEKDKQ
jgi:Anticodon binding domain.